MFYIIFNAQQYIAVSWSSSVLGPIHRNGFTLECVLAQSCEDDEDEDGGVSSSWTFYWSQMDFPLHINFIQ